MKRKIKWDRVLLLVLAVLCIVGDVALLREHRLRQAYQKVSIEYCEAINIDDSKCNFLKNRR